MPKPTSIYPRHFLMGSVQRQPSGFILMPFASGFRDVFDAIQLAIADADLTPKRADDEFLTRASLEKILRGILEAEVVVADMTGRNPNVFYEVGIAHATKENVVLLAQSIKDDVPFDLQHIDHLEYDPTQEGLKRLRDRLGTIIKGLPPEPQVLVRPTFEGGLRIRDGVQEHELYRFDDGGETHLVIHMVVTNTGTGSLTLVEPLIEFDDPSVEAHYRFLVVETGGGRKSVAMSPGRTAVVSARYTVTTKTALGAGDELSGVLLARVAQPGLEPIRYRFKAAYRADGWRTI